MVAVTLIVPPSAFLLDERVFMHLGVLRVAAVLERANVPVRVLDLSGVANFEEAVRAYCADGGSRVFGLTATTPQMPAATRIVETIRQAVPGPAKVILGGPHVTLVAAARKREERLGIDGRATAAFNHLLQDYDVLVAGDGERAIFEAIEPQTTGLIDADDPRSALFLSSTDVTALPFPARHLVDVDSYHYTIDGVRALSMIAQLGCPFECGFCGGRNSPFLRRVRTRTDDSIVAEMVHLYQAHGVRGFMLYDDELNVNKGLVTLLDRIKAAQDQLGVEFRLRGFVKAELFTAEQAAAMFAAGFRWILVGFESGSPRILQNINKKASRDDNTRCLSLARDAGLKVKALMSIGHPGESARTILDTQEWLLEVRPDDFDLTIITTYPGTPYYDNAVPHPDQPDTWIYTAEKSGDRLYGLEVDYRTVADYYKGDPSGGYVSFVYTDHIDRASLVRMRDGVESAVRKQLNIPFNHATPALRYEHSMGQIGAPLPSHILRASAVAASAA